MKTFSFLSLSAMALLSLLTPSQLKANDFSFAEWDRLAIQDGGRTKPMSSFARESLIKIYGKPSFTSADDRNWSYSNWVMSMLLRDHEWHKEKMILVAHRPLVEELGLDPSEKHFSFEELRGIERLMELVQEAHTLRAAEATLSKPLLEAENVGARLTLFVRISDGSAFMIIPPLQAGPSPEGSAWMDPTQAKSIYGAERFGLIESALQQIGGSYQQKDQFKFDTAVSKLRSSLREINSDIYPTQGELDLEVTYNNLTPFYWSMILYMVALIVLIGAGIKQIGKYFFGAAYGIASIGLLLHISGMVMRCVITGRPPVTNMYESVIWVAFGVVLFALIFVAIYRTPVYLAAGLPASFVCLAIIHQIPIAMPDRLDPLVPVLRSNFWLTVHVLTICTSYAAFALSMVLGLIILWKYIREPQKAHDDGELHFWNYRVLQVGVLLLATGTILGGVWANYSWGRFWGWDPKETWALIALLAYIFALHGRLAGWWNKFGLAVASVLCFMTIIMAWYGVNFVLGVGLHSYGFGLGGEEYVITVLTILGMYVAIAMGRYLSAKKSKKSGNDTPAEAT